MTYDELPQAEKDTLAVWERNVRGWINSILSKGIIQARALDASMNAAGGAGSILDSLDAGEIVPNSGNIAGALDLTKEQWLTLRAIGLGGFLSTYDTVAVRQVAATAAGPLAGL